MAPLFYISAFFITLLATCIADRISVRSPEARLEAIKSTPEFRFLPPVTKREQNDDLTLLDVVLVASVDGKFHALDRTTGQSLWSMSSSTSTSTSPSPISPLVRTNHLETDPDTTDDEMTNQELYIIEPQSGDIFVMTSPSSPLQRLPYSMPELVDMSPFSFKGEDETRVFVGRKETSLLTVDLDTGKVKAINSECPWDPPAEPTSEAHDLDLDELEKPPKPISVPREVLIGRTDYHISIHTRSPYLKTPVQNLSFSTYGPNNQDLQIQKAYHRTMDDAYIQPLPNGEIIAFKAPNPNPDSPFMWGSTFPNTIVAVFDVLTSSSRHTPFVLAQPSTRLKDMLPNGDSRLDNLDFNSAFVGLVEQTGALFAMSYLRYPLVVAFGNANTNAMRNNLLDGPPEKRDSDADLSDTVDGVTKARKYREMLCRNGSPNRDCLTGVHKLGMVDSQSRLRRLLDGVPSVQLPPKTDVKNAVVEETFQPTQVKGNFSMTSPRTWPGFEDPLSLLDGPVANKISFSALAALFVATALGIVWFIRKKLMVTATSNLGEKVPVETNITDYQSVADKKALPPLPLDLPQAPHSAITEGDITTPQPKTQLDDDGNNDAEDSEREGDAVTTPGRRKVRRGKRAKKKKAVIPGDEAVDDDKTKISSDVALESLAFPDSPPPTSMVITTSKPTTITTSLHVSDTILGFGSHGTVVFQGSLQGRAVAVKRLLQDFVTLAAREVSILQESDDHPNVIRYYYQEAHANFLYIALELCPASLADIIERPDLFQDISIVFDPKRALRQITSGLRHLHALKLVHRDIKPQNILISSTKSSGGRSDRHRMLISDFGLCKKLDVDQTSFLPTGHGAMAAGTVGWRAPEILRGEVKLDLETIGSTDEHSHSSRGSTSSTGTINGSSTSNGVKPTRLTKSVDIFALGCLFYYTMTNGEHPYGDRFEREVNILKDAKCLDSLKTKTFGEEGMEAADLIEHMLHPEAKQRPDTTTCLLHPFFWDSGKRLTFLQDASDRFEIMDRDPPDLRLLTLETGALQIIGPNWHAQLDRVFIENLGKFRKYQGHSVQDLLRALRNKKHHYQDLPPSLKRQIGSMPDGFLAYFTNQFPNLFLHVHSVVSSAGLDKESMFKSYFELPEGQ